jgi:hypothetical protein
MTPDELKAEVEAAKAAFNDRVADARAGGVTVNLWVRGTGPSKTGDSVLDLDFLNPTQ